jgi:carbonic anhydrase/acetyltransferase-like protein (isoleucine patch superfamily)
MTKETSESPLSGLNFASVKIPSTAWVAPSADVFGNVVLGEQTIVLFQAVLRGDTELIEIGAGSNVQDACILHADPGLPCRIGKNCTLGHRALVHGATVEDDCLIGIGAIVLNGARIGRGSLIAAGALIPEGTVIPPNSVVMGVPGKVVRETTELDRDRIAHAARHYQGCIASYQQRFAPQ